MLIGLGAWGFGEEELLSIVLGGVQKFKCRGRQVDTPAFVLSLSLSVGQGDRG